MEEKILTSVDTQKTILAVVNKICNTAKITLGPKGKNVLLSIDNTPLITNDGVTIAKHIILNSPEEKLVAKIIKQASIKTNEISGDGTTTSLVLTQALINNGIKLLNQNISPYDIKIGLNKALTFCENELMKNSKNIKSQNDLEKIATMSCGDKYFGTLIAQAYSKLGKNGVVLMKDSLTDKSYVEYIDGLQLNFGLASPYFLNNMSNLTYQTKNALLLISKVEINSMNQIIEILTHCNNSHTPLMIVSKNITEEIISTLVMNKMQSGLDIAVIKPQISNIYLNDILEDIACLTNSTIVENEDDFTTKNLGICKTIKADKESLTVIPKEKSTKLKSRINQLSSELLSTQGSEKLNLQMRIAKLTTGIAFINISNCTNIELNEKKLRIEDAISATKLAYNNGIVAGGGVSLINLEKNLKIYIRKLNSNEQIGATLLYNSLKEPLLQIVKNSYYDSQKMYEKIKGYLPKNKLIGFNAYNGKVTQNYYNAGIIDPVTVVISALKTSVSITSTILTTDAIIC